MFKQILREYKRPKQYLPIVAAYPGDCFQMDIMVYNRFEYDRYKYILTCIDVYSRYAQAIPMKPNKSDELVPAVINMFKEKMGKIPKHLNVDQELWKNNQLQTIYKDKDIKVYPSVKGEVNKNAIIERFHRTLAKYLMQYRIEMDDENWPSYLDKVLDYYNNKVNRGTGYTPIQLYTGQIPNYYPITKYIKMKAALPFNFKVGQYVLVLTNKERFAKGDIGNLAIYKIRQIVGRKIYLNEIKPDGVEVVDSKPYKPYELEPISEDTVKLIMERHIYHTQLQRRITHTQTKKAKKAQSDLVSAYRRQLKKKIKRLISAGDNEEAARLQRELEASYKRRK